MANSKHLKILKKGVKVWNEWREGNPDITPDLEGAHLEGANLMGANLSRADLALTILDRTNLDSANLRQANLDGANLRLANLRQAILELASLRLANLGGANLRQANLCGAILIGVDLSEANLIRAGLFKANLNHANLYEVRLDETDLKGTQFGVTKFINLDLSKTKGLKSCDHLTGSHLSTKTLIKSKGKIPIEFLRGCGLSDWEIESAKLYKPGLSNQEVTDIIYRIHEIRTTQAIQISPLFISYSHSDCDFVDQLGQELTSKGVRFWRDTHHSTAGKLEKQIDRAMRVNDIVLLILSKDSVNSDWVEHEAKKARKLEKELKKDILCPLALDDSWKDCDWPEMLRDQIEKYNILDFSAWQNPNSFQRMFAKLLNGLDLFYKD